MYIEIMHLEKDCRKLIGGLRSKLKGIIRILKPVTSFRHHSPSLQVNILYVTLHIF